MVLMSKLNTPVLWDHSLIQNYISAALCTSVHVQQQPELRLPDCHQLHQLQQLLTATQHKKIYQNLCALKKAGLLMLKIKLAPHIFYARFCTITLLFKQCILVLWGHFSIQNFTSAVSSTIVLVHPCLQQLRLPLKH
jgi:hypothetical protein